MAVVVVVVVGVVVAVAVDSVVVGDIAVVGGGVRVVWWLPCSPLSFWLLVSSVGVYVVGGVRFLLLLLLFC